MSEKVSVTVDRNCRRTILDLRMGDCFGCLAFIYLFTFEVRFASDKFLQGGRDVQTLKHLLHFTGSFVKVSSGFFLPCSILILQGSRNILEHVNYRQYHCRLKRGKGGDIKLEILKTIISFCKVIAFS